MKAAFQAQVSIVLMAFCFAGTRSHAETPSGWQVYGQVNLGLMSVDDGADQEAYFAENPHIPRRFGFRYTSLIGTDATLMFQFETGFGLTDLGEVSPDNDDLDLEIDKTVLRKFEVIYAAPRFGQLSLGQGSMASDGASGTDLSGTSLAIGPAIGDLGGATVFLPTSGENAGPTVGDVFDDLDGPRRLRARYDTPRWNGLSFALAYGQEILRDGNDLNYRDVGLSYARETNTLNLEAAASYEWIGSVEERVLFSASVLHKISGLSATLASGANHVGAGKYIYAKLGLQRDFFRLGRTSIAVEYYDGGDLGFAGSDSRAIGIGLTQNLAEYGVDLVAAHRRYDLTSSETEFQTIEVTMLGARWRF